MARRKPVSGKLKKAQLQHTRAVKHAKDAGETAPAAPKAVRSHSRKVQNGGHSFAVARKYMTPEEEARYARKEASLKIESRFLKLPGEMIEYFRTVLSTLPLARPIEPRLGILSDVPSDVELTCPRRPKWSYNSSKEQVEKNEEGLFRKWLEQTDTLLKSRQDAHPTFFERNLNVWRQLWRVTEQSDILLVLADVRFPLLHLPPSLRTYLATNKPKRPVVIVLTKTDLVSPDIAAAWKKYLEQLLPDTAVVLMQSYREAEANQSNQTRFVPEAPEDARHALIEAIKQAHRSIVQPPESVRNDPVKLARWKPRARVDIDWDTIVPPRTKLSTHSYNNHSAASTEAEDDAHPFLTLGLLGQPNVGKSSLLNALLGRKVVRASKTPGKTKTFQTIFLNQTLRLVDCPGLVCPSTVSFEQQVLGAIIPIQHVEAVVHLVGERMALEKILSLRPDDEFALEEQVWTTDAILSAYADQQGFVTAKAGRPDLHRAGSQILRMLHSGAVSWSFLPPNADTIEHEGIWLPHFKPSRIHDIAQEDSKGEDDLHEFSDGTETSCQSERDVDEAEDSEPEQSSGSESAYSGTAGMTSAGNTFAALSLDDEAEE